MGSQLGWRPYLRSRCAYNSCSHCGPPQVVLYDFNTDTVKDFLCYGRQGGQAVPMRDYNFHRTLMEGPWRGGMKPLDVVQREGPSFSVDGNAVAWQHWSFRVGFSWREGLILYKLG